MAKGGKQAGAWPEWGLSAVWLPPSPQQHPLREWQLKQGGEESPLLREGKVGTKPLLHIRKGNITPSGHSY